ncbi:MAG: cyclase family protein [Desulfarculus sp.]|nr:cyclase family protein [Pseudomonadota bacterium]MBU4596701.1 cyclase family protein [Pseudomonadota bacterium]MBV1716895.1 cyclase family protein [Desulfarculus sp.]MBV1738398.1 cyclase family protein [Desulfarculus sp.]
MKQRLVRLIMALVAVSFLCMAGQAMAENKYMPKPSKWGPDDQIGNANYLTPKKVLEAVKLVKEGKVFDLGNEYYKGFPAYPPRDVFVWLLVHGLTVDPPRGYDKATDMEEFVSMSTGLSTQLDGFAHVGHDHVFYNATKQKDIVSASGAKKFGMETVPPLVTRAVMVDMVDFLGRNLGPAEEISLKDFKACLAKHNLNIQPGDAVLINTGWMRLLGTDQWCTEVYPHKGFPKDLYGAGFVPCHVILLGNGIYQFQNLKLADLAKACKADGKYDFFFNFTHPKIRGTVQGIGQPIAIK